MSENVVIFGQILVDVEPMSTACSESLGMRLQGAFSSSKVWTALVSSVCIPSKCQR
jgi:hypothetical protein